MSDEGADAAQALGLTGTEGTARKAWLKKEARPCGAPQHRLYPDRCVRGHTDMRVLGARTVFKPADWKGLQHSVCTDRWPPGLEVLRDEIAAFMRGCLADEGGAASVPTRALSLLGRRARIRRRAITRRRIDEDLGTDRKAARRTARSQHGAQHITQAGPRTGAGGVRPRRPHQHPLA